MTTKPDQAAQHLVLATRFESLRRRPEQRDMFLWNDEPEWVPNVTTDSLLEALREAGYAYLIDGADPDDIEVCVYKIMPEWKQTKFHRAYATTPHDALVAAAVAATEA